MFHSDRGVNPDSGGPRNTGGDFADLTRANGVVLSVGKNGMCRTTL